MANYNGGRLRFKQRVIRYLGGSCAHCNYSKCPAALHVHHLDPSKKEFSIGASRCRKWEAVQGELDKCVLLCANCHAEAHYKEPEAREAPPGLPVVIWPSASDLANLVDTLPLTKIAKQLGVSDVSVRKRCKKLGIPTRSRGGWSKKALV
jgi:hypothetical protein